MSPEAFFTAQLGNMKNALTSNCYLMGDFNLDPEMEYRPDYHHRIPLSHFSDPALNANQTQIVNFDPWSRTIKGTKKQSLLDDIYINNTNF